MQERRYYLPGMPPEIIIPHQKPRTLESIGLAVAAAALALLLGFFMLIAYLLAAFSYYDTYATDCLEEPFLLWVLGLSMLAAILAAGAGLAYTGASLLELNGRLAVRLTIALLMPAVVAGLVLIPTINHNMINGVCWS